jgi:carbonic anhydrase/acetyltransferase-like protein (isoleucine patch superfamily)
VVLEGRTIPPRSVAVGAPAKVKRKATDRDVRMIRESYRAYVKMAQKYSSSGAFDDPIG